jgi:hypothetical protein
MSNELIIAEACSEFLPLESPSVTGKKAVGDRVPIYELVVVFVQTKSHSSIKNGRYKSRKIETAALLQLR